MSSLYDPNSPSGLGNWPRHGSLTHLSAAECVDYEKKRTFMIHINVINHSIPGAKAYRISGAERWNKIFAQYDLITRPPYIMKNPHCLRSKWSKTKTAMLNIIALNKSRALNNPNAAKAMQDAAMAKAARAEETSAGQAKATEKAAEESLKTMTKDQQKWQQWQQELSILQFGTDLLTRE